jgi:hypothetical protein
MAHPLLSMLLADEYSHHLAPNNSGVALMMIHTTNSVNHTEVDEAHKTVNFCSELTDGHATITMTKPHKKCVCKSQKSEGYY